MTPAPPQPGRGPLAALPPSLRWRPVGAALCLLGVEAPRPDGGLGPIDWVPPWPDLLPDEPDLLWIEGPAAERVVLPHRVELGPFGPGEGGAVAVRVASELLFRPGLRSEEAGQAWDDQADTLGTRRPYDPRYGTARLREVSRRPPALSFEPVRYTDYVRTNLGLDCPLPDGRSLRALECAGGRLRPLHRSLLANTVGTGVLLFSADGALIVQRRSEGRVLFRAGELCPGGSGTLDWDDVLRCRGGRLSALDVYREAYEEAGVQPVTEQLLGVTRELIRLDPGIWMAADVAETAAHMAGDAARRRRDDEGAILAVGLGPLGRARPDPAPTRAEFWAMISALGRLGPPSVPLLTNLALWWISADPRRGGVAPLAALAGEP